MDRDSERQRRRRQHHDAAFRQGAGIRHRVPARLGGRPVSASALARRKRPRGLEEERRLAHVGLTRARKRAKLYFATNRRIHGLWNSTIPSRFLDELPEAHVEVTEAKGGVGNFGGPGMAGRRLRRLALRQFRAGGLELCHARLAARAEAQEGEFDGFGDEARITKPTRAIADDDSARTLLHLPPCGGGRPARRPGGR